MLTAGNFSYLRKGALKREKSRTGNIRATSFYKRTDWKKNRPGTKKLVGGIKTTRVALDAGKVGVVGKFFKR